MKDTKQKIVDGALELFSKNSYDGTSIRDIAKHTGVNVAMVSYYFGSKEGFFEYAIDSVYKRQKDVYQRLEQQDLSEYDRLLELLRLEVEEIIENFFSLKLILIETKIKKREAIVKKMSETIDYVNGYMTEKIKKYKPEISENISKYFPVMIHSSTFDLVVRKFKEYDIDEFKLNNKSNQNAKMLIKQELFEIYKDFLDEVIK